MLETCTSLKYIDLPNNITWIDEEAFSGCKSLQRIDIPQNVTTISMNAFSFCTSLREIHSHILEIEKCDINSGAFDNFDCDNCTLYVPARTAETYKAHKVFGKFKNIVEE